MRSAGLWIAPLAILALAPPALAQSLGRDEPGHQAPVPPGGFNLPLAPTVVPHALPPQWVVIRSKDEWKKAGKIDKKLSDACAARKFIEREPLRFRAFFKGEVLGVAFGYGLNLNDAGKLADKRMIYFFRNGDATGCLVLVTKNQDPGLLKLLDAQDAAAAANGAGAGAGAGAKKPVPGRP